MYDPYISLDFAMVSHQKQHYCLCRLGFLDLFKATLFVMCLLHTLSKLNLPIVLNMALVFGSISSGVPASFGVSQGSILGPILFILYFSHITKYSISSSTSLMLYADNILLYHSVVSIHCLRKVQLDLDAISSWLSYRFLNMNSNKTKYVI